MNPYRTSQSALVTQEVSLLTKIKRHYTKCKRKSLIKIFGTYKTRHAIICDICKKRSDPRFGDELFNNLDCGHSAVQIIAHRYQQIEDKIYQVELKLHSLG